MTLIFPEHLMIALLRSRIPPNATNLYMDRAETLTLLRLISGIDLGDDIESWVSWISEDTKRFRDLFMKFPMDDFVSRSE
jgi:hypothetical protein